MAWIERHTGKHFCCMTFNVKCTYFVLLYKYIFFLLPWNFSHKNLNYTMKKNTCISQCDGRDLVQFLTLLVLTQETAVSFKLIRQKSQLYRKQQYKMTFVLQNTAEKSSWLSTKLHFLKLFVQTENADGSHTQSESSM